MIASFPSSVSSWIQFKSYLLDFLRFNKPHSTAEQINELSLAPTGLVQICLSTVQIWSGKCMKKKTFIALITPSCYTAIDLYPRQRRLFKVVFFYCCSSTKNFWLLSFKWKSPCLTKLRWCISCLHCKAGDRLAHIIAAVHLGVTLTLD